MGPWAARAGGGNLSWGAGMGSAWLYGPFQPNHSMVLWNQLEDERSEQTSRSRTSSSGSPMQLRRSEGTGWGEDQAEQPPTFLLVVRLLLPTPAQALQRPRHLAAKLILPGAGFCPLRRLLLLLVLVVIQDGGLADGHADDRVVGLQARVAEALSGLGAQQHRGDVVDLVGGLGAGTLLRDAAALVPAPLGVQSHCEDQEEQEQSDQPTLWDSKETCQQTQGWLRSSVHQRSLSSYTKSFNQLQAGFWRRSLTPQWHPQLSSAHSRNSFLIPLVLSGNVHGYQASLPCTRRWERISHSHLTAQETKNSLKQTSNQQGSHKVSAETQHFVQKTMYQMASLNCHPPGEQRTKPLIVPRASPPPLLRTRRWGHPATLAGHGAGPLHGSSGCCCSEKHPTAASCTQILSSPKLWSHQSC